MTIYFGLHACLFLSCWQMITVSSLLRNGNLDASIPCGIVGTMATPVYWKPTTGRYQALITMVLLSRPSMPRFVNQVSNSLDSRRYRRKDRQCHPDVVFA